MVHARRAQRPVKDSGECIFGLGEGVWMIEIKVYTYQRGLYRIE
jgi:hypothetical protein